MTPKPPPSLSDVWSRARCAATLPSGLHFKRHEWEALVQGHDADLARLREENAGLASQLAEMASTAIKLRELLREARPHLGDRLSQFRVGSPRDVALSDLCTRIYEATA